MSVDIHFVLKDEAIWKDKGIEEIDGVVFEYVINPFIQLKRYLENDIRLGRNAEARMYANGKILFDKSGQLTSLKENATIELKRGFEKPSEFELELIKYNMWEILENLQELFFEESPSFDLVYFTFLDRIIKNYSKFIQVAIPHFSQLYKFLTDSDFGRKYCIKPFPDKLFADKFVDCLKADTRSKKFSQVKILVTHMLANMGGFEFKAWKILPAEDFNSSK